MQSNGYCDITKILTHISVSQEPIKKREATLSLSNRGEGILCKKLVTYVMEELQ